MTDERDPWAFQRWAFAQITGNSTRKAVLSHLAMMADHGTGRCEAKQRTIAQGVETSPETVGRHLRALEEQGLIARRAQIRRDGGRRGDEFLLLAPWITEWPDGEPVATPPSDRRGGSDQTPPPTGEGSPPAPARGQERPSRTATSETDETRDPRERAPEGFPEHLRPHARAVLPILQAVAQAHGARRVWPQAVGLLLMANGRKPLVATAHELQVWSVDPPRPIKDVVATYRTFLGQQRDLAGVERLHDDLMPATAGPRGVAGAASSDSANLRAMAARLREQGQ